jgi:hypothetical protein
VRQRREASLSFPRLIDDADRAGSATWGSRHASGCTATGRSLKSSPDVGAMRPGHAALGSARQRRGALASASWVRYHNRSPPCALRRAVRISAPALRRPGYQAARCRQGCLDATRDQCPAAEAGSPPVAKYKPAVGEYARRSSHRPVGSRARWRRRRRTDRFIGAIVAPSRQLVILGWGRWARTAQLGEHVAWLAAP